VVLASAVAHMAKGLDFEESTASILLLIALIRYRSRFDVPGEPTAIRPVLAGATALAAAGAVALGVELHGGELPSRLSDLFTALGLLLGFGALFLWLRPLTHAVAQTVGERRVARAIVDAYGSDSPLVLRATGATRATSSPRRANRSSPTESSQGQP